jgi:hypothetical protein
MDGRPPHVGSNVSVSTVFSRKNLVIMLAVGIVVGFEAGLVDGLVADTAVGISYGLAYGVGVMFLLGVLYSVMSTTPESARSLDPVTSRRENRSYGLSAGLVSGLVVGLVAACLGAVVYGPAYGLAVGILGAGMIGISVAILTIESYPVSLAALQLAVRWGTPVRLMRFLEDAHDRGVLRTVGPTYQFRHARLQDRLAASASSPGTGQPTAANGSAAGRLANASLSSERRLVEPAALSAVSDDAPAATTVRRMPPPR